MHTPNTLINRYYDESPDHDLVTPELALSTLRKVVPTLVDVIPEVEIPSFSRFTGKIADLPSDSVRITSEPTRYNLPSGQARAIRLLAIRPRLLHEAGIEAVDETELQLQVESAKPSELGLYRTLGSLSREAFAVNETPDARAIRTGRVWELQEFLHAVELIKSDQSK